jgi:DNA-binding transcriptional ArsR family regulator
MALAQEYGLAARVWLDCGLRKAREQGEPAVDNAFLDTLIAGEKAVGAIVDDLSMSQPQVSKHLRVLSEVGLVRCRAEGRRRLYRLEPARLRPLHEWLAKYEQAWNDRLDRMDDYLKNSNNKESRSDT